MIDRLSIKDHNVKKALLYLRLDAGTITDITSKVHEEEFMNVDDIESLLNRARDITITTLNLAILFLRKETND